MTENLVPKFEEFAKHFDAIIQPIALLLAVAEASKFIHKLIWILEHDPQIEDITQFNKEFHELYDALLMLEQE